MWPLRDKKQWDGAERRNKDRVRLLRIRNPIRIFRISNMRKRLLVYFFLIVFVTMSVGLQLIYEMGSPRFQQIIKNSVTVSLSRDTGMAEADVSGIGSVMTRMQFRMMLIMGIVFVCVMATMFVFIRNIVEPLDAMGKSVKRIAEGHLDETVPIRCDDEIGKIGVLINDLSVNLQEVLLHVWNHTRQDLVLLDHMAEIIHAQPYDIFPRKVKEEFDFVRKDIEEMQEIVKAFEYYHIRFEGDKLIDEAVQVAEETDKPAPQKTQPVQFESKDSGDPTGA